MSKAQRSIRRHHRARVIARRIFIRRHIWLVPPEHDRDHPGRYAKYNMVCSCWMCTYDKIGASKRRRQAVKREIRQLLAELAEEASLESSAEAATK